MVNVTHQSPVLGTNWPEDPRCTTEALPVLVLFDVGHNAGREIALDAELAEDVRTLRATVDFATLATPTTIELGAIITAHKLSTIVEVVAL